MQQLTAPPRSTSQAAAESPPSRPGSGAMFDSIAARYDRLNRLLSLGLDRRWRRRAVASLGAQPGWRILDLATGTADVAIEAAQQQSAATVVGLDPSRQMLAVGERKVAEAGLAGRIELRHGHGESLPFDDDTFDGVTIAWGIRNVADRPASLREMARVVRPDGRIAILESNEPRSGPLAWGARLYLHQVVPRVGAWLSQERAYRYLQTSTEAFPAPEEFAKLMASCGLEVLEVQPQTFGVCCLYVARPGVARPGVARPGVARPEVARPAQAQPPGAQPDLGGVR
ncbi:MAG: bifunctional demethylmenaquinone methyltransferase/2-methoxy-6-polyprenyl-1,4-benzoquinol methylase UbiE [Acidobacteriota bacterium]